MTDYVLLGVMCVAAIGIGLVFRGIRKINDDAYMPEDDDPGFDIATDIAKKAHEKRSEKLREVLKAEDPEEDLADLINTRGSPL